MSEATTVLLLALLPAAGNFAGGILAEVYRPTAKVLNWALHLAAGIVIGIVAIELAPNALQALPGWIVGICFLGGAALYQLVEMAVDHFQKRENQAKGGSVWMIYFAVATDLFSDGLMIGTGVAVSASLGFTLALGQVLADVPEGFSVIANFRDKGATRRRRLWLSASFAIPVLIAAAGAFFLLRQQSEALQMGMLMITAGILTTAAVEEMIPEAHATAKDTRLAAFAFAFGFAAFATISGVLE